MGGAADAVDQMAAQLGQAGIPGLLFGEAGGYKPPDLRPLGQQLKEAQEKAEELRRELELQEKAPKTSGQIDYLKSLTEQLGATQLDVERLITAFERMEHRAAAALRVEIPVAPPAGPGAVGRSMADAYAPMAKSAKETLATMEVLSKREITFVEQRRKADEEAASERTKANKKAETEGDQLAKVAKRETEERLRTVAALEAQLAAAQATVAMAGEGAFAAELMTIEAEKQQEIQKLSLEHRGEELAGMVKLVEATAEMKRIAASIKIPVPTAPSITARAAETASMKEFEKTSYITSEGVVKEYITGLDKGREATDRFAQTQYDILIRPWEELAVDINQTMAGVFDQNSD